MEMEEKFTADIVTRAIKSCRNSKAFGPDKLSIFHLKNLGRRAIEYITGLLNLSVTNCQIPAIWKSSLIILIPKPGKDTSQGSSYRHISFHCYVDDLTVWPTGVKIPDMEDILNSYLAEITAFLQDTSLLISTPKWSVILFTPDTHQANTHPKIHEDSQLLLAQCPKIFISMF